MAQVLNDEENNSNNATMMYNNEKNSKHAKIRTRLVFKPQFYAQSRNSAYDNPAVISSCSPVINLMIFLMKVTSLPSTGCSVLLYGTEQRWPEETSSTHF